MNLLFFSWYARQDSNLQKRLKRPNHTKEPAGHARGFRFGAVWKGALWHKVRHKLSTGAAAALLALALPAQAQTFTIEFWPPLPDRTRQVEHFFACAVGTALEYKYPLMREGAIVVGGFVFVSRESHDFRGLYKITSVTGTPTGDGNLRDVVVKAICTTGLS